jgi:hypothetical protein
MTSDPSTIRCLLNCELCLKPQILLLNVVEFEGGLVGLCDKCRDRLDKVSVAKLRQIASGREKK